MSSDKNCAPLAMSFAPTAIGQRISATLALTLLFISFNLAGIFFQLRSVPEHHTLFALVGLFSGCIAGALLADGVEKRAGGPHGAAWRRGFFAVLLLPGLLGLFAFLLTGFRGNILVNTLAPLLWTIPQAPALRLFFRHTPATPDRAVWFGLTTGAGHFCWALLMPLARIGLIQEYSDYLLFFVHLIRCLLVIAVAILIWRTLEREAAAGYVEPPPFPAPRGRTALVLGALLPCFLMNGLLDLRLYSRTLLQGNYPELTQLALTFFFPLAGLWLAGKTERLHWLFSALLLCFAAMPLLFVPGLSPRLERWLLVLGASGHQVLLFGAALALAPLASSFSRPALLLVAPWILSGLGMALHALRMAVLPIFPFNPLFPALLLSLGCLAFIILLRRVFPLPETPALAETAAPQRLPSENSTLQALRLQAETKQRAFAAAFALTAREIETLDAVLRGLEREAIGLELGISESTVKFHIRSLLRKTGTSSRQRLLHFYTNWRAD